MDKKIALHMKKIFFFTPLFFCILFAPAFAHTLDASYLDIGAAPSGSGASLALTVAIHPVQALTIVGLSHAAEHGESAGFGQQIPDLIAKADLIKAYTATHVSVSADGILCTWEPTAVVVPPTEIDALADGVSMTAPLFCEGNPEALEITSTLLIERFPQQRNIVRVEVPGGYENRLTLDRQTTQGTLSLADAAIKALLISSAPERTPGEPFVQWMGWVVFLFALGGISVVGYRMNIASPKE
ncbi:MAG: hypothetical protein RL141_324 [Candidatus Parcubacteria bacterium]|jgi:hypothetical protein